MIVRDPFRAIFSYYNYWLQARLQKSTGTGKEEAHIFRQRLDRFQPKKFEAFAMRKAAQWRDQWLGCLESFNVFGATGQGAHDSAAAWHFP